MSDKVKHYMLIDGIGIAINTFITIVLCNLCSSIGYEFIEITLKLIIGITSILIDLFVVSFFLLYWWSDIKWTQCKQKARSFKRKFLN